MSANVQDRRVTPDVPRFKDNEVPEVGRAGVLARPHGAITEPCGARTIPTDARVARLNGNPWRART